MDGAVVQEPRHGVRGEEELAKNVEVTDKPLQAVSRVVGSVFSGRKRKWEERHRRRSMDHPVKVREAMRVCVLMHMIR